MEAEWGVSELARSAKFYRLTPEGRAQLVARTREWEVFASAVSRILLGPAGPAGALG